jgi:AraC-like DNA-binding protein
MRFPAYCHIKFGGVLEGSFSLWVEGSVVPVKLNAGDFYLLTNGQAYCSATDPVLAPLDGRLIFDAYKDADGVVRYGAGGNKVVAAGGRFTFDDATSDILLKQLPPLIHIPAGAEGAGPLGAIIDLLSYETKTIQPGSAVSAGSIANVVLVHILRAHLATSPQPTGWLSAIMDARVGAALTLMHGDLARRWKVEDLALAVGMSRTAFTQRFKTLVGLPPLDYLMRWRMTVAGTELRRGDKSLSSIAESVGYASDTAFNSAFKRTIGQSPGRYRLGNSSR